MVRLKIKMILVAAILLLPVGTTQGLSQHVIPSQHVFPIPAEGTVTVHTDANDEHTFDLDNTKGKGTMQVIAVDGEGHAIKDADGNPVKLDVPAGSHYISKVKSHDEGVFTLIVKQLASLIPGHTTKSVKGSMEPHNSVLTLGGLPEAFFGPKIGSSVDLPEEYSLDGVLDISDPNHMTFSSLTTTLKLPSLPILDGQSETGPIVVSLDPSVPVTGSIDLIAQTFKFSSRLLVDMPQVRLYSDANPKGGPIPVLETITGTFSQTSCGDVLYQDDFSNPNSGWFVGSGNGFDWGYTGNGEYRVLVSNPNWQAWSWAPTNVTNNTPDFCLEVDANQIAAGGLSDDGAMGLIFAGNRQTQTFSSFLVAPKRGLYLLPGTTQWTKSDAILGPGNSNHLLIAAKDGRVDFYVNGTYLDTIVVNVAGDVGVITETFDTPYTNAHFANFVVRAVK
jgi:hypothetical protein